MPLLSDTLKGWDEDTTQVDKTPAQLPLSIAKNINTVAALAQNDMFVPMRSRKDSSASKFMQGVEMSVKSLADVAPTLEMFGEEVQMGIGGYFGAKEEFIDRKKANIATLQRNLVRQQRERYRYTKQDTQQSLAFGLGQGLTNFALMYVTGGGASLGAKALLGVGAKTAAKVGATAGILSAVPLENVDQQSDRIKFDENGNVAFTVSVYVPTGVEPATVTTPAFVIVIYDVSFVPSVSLTSEYVYKPVPFVAPVIVKD